MKFTLLAVAFLALVSCVFSVTIPGNVGRRWYVGGNFDKLLNKDKSWTLAKNFAYWNGVEWGKITGEPNGVVYTIIMDIKFNILIGGSFTKVGTVLTGPVARFSSADSKWEKITSSSATWSTGSTVMAITPDCFSTSLKQITATRCDVYFGGLFTLTDGVTARNVARWKQTSNSEGAIENLGSHGITGPVYALHKKSVPTLTSSSSKYLWVGGNLNVANGPKYFGRFEAVTSAPALVNLDDGMNGPVFDFEYIVQSTLGSTDSLFLVGNFDFMATTAKNSDANKTPVFCPGVCKYNHKEKKFLEFAGVRTQFLGSSSRTIGRNGNDVYIGGNFTQLAALKYVAKLPSGKATWDTVQVTQSTKVDFPVTTLDVCNKYSKSCPAGSVAVGGWNGQVAFFDNELATWENFGGAKMSFNNSAGMAALTKIYSYAGAGHVEVTFVVVACMAILSLILV